MRTTLPERSEHVAEKLAAITAVIRELMGDELAMLILFGSYARGDWVQDRYVEGDIVYSYESDFDLLVVSESRNNATVKGELRLTEAISRRLEHAKLDRPSASVIVEDIKNLNKALERGQYFYSDIQKEGVLLFDNGRHALSEAKPIEPAQRQQYAREDFDYWFGSANSFLIDFQHAFDRNDTNKAAFELHQATERLFHAIILTFTGYKPKLHDLEKLDRQASDLHLEFFKAFPRATEEQKHRFRLLKEAYIEARYNRHWTITKEELDYLAARVCRLQELAKRICEAKIVGMA